MHINDIEAVSQYAPVENGPPAARVAVIDPRILLRDCIVRYISTHHSFEARGFVCVDEIANPGKPCDYSMAVVCSITETRQITLGELARLRKLSSFCPVLVLTDSEDRDLMDNFLDHGASGVVPLTCPAHVVIEALRFVLAGETFAPFENFHANTQAGATPGAPKECALTKREEQIVALLQSGKQNKQIAYELNLSIGTVKVHLHNIMSKLGAHNRIQVLAFRGLIGGTRRSATGHLPHSLVGMGTIADLVRATTTAINGFR